MERKEAIALLKELVDNNLAQPSLVILQEKSRGKFELQMKDECDNEALRDFLTKKNFGMKQDTEKGYCVIYKP